MTSQYNLTNVIKRSCNCLIEDINRREFTDNRTDLENIYIKNSKQLQKRGAFGATGLKTIARLTKRICTIMFCANQMEMRLPIQYDKC